MNAQDVITFDSVEDIEAVSLPLDMRDEILEALSSGRETAVEYRRAGGYNEQPTHYLYFPNAMRGGVCCGGDSEWSDCYNLDDLADRWANYEERWSN